ncbi:3'(2'),5'-bisphosphate nucleotidase CysQ [Methyloligella sp. 2.7D]|uniref:3'(2'),5'-bisphosphate nucleotidase CysQ n=1 Tax=unclassified Methyloligella TaxID=2625955 RepID=UPI00157BC07F|nr:3'(2'),5'-bisphosphate nucleotidase CysQ [Methyloligella sp. GL2]QKP76918.1 3'(2'),5'-bisphosphate nucleotidase CysQ [Methyloligella sp. GL2]
MPDFDFETACTVLLGANLEAGACIMRHYASDVAVETKADNSPVTLADGDAERVLLPALAKLAPDIPVVSEESAKELDADRGARFFLVDPLDGTKEFIKKRTDFTVNVALIENGTPVFGIVYAPALKLLAFTLAPGKAVATTLTPGSAAPSLSELDLKPLAVRPAPAEGLTAVVSASHLDAETEAFLEEHPIAARESAGSSLKFLKVAQGEADVYPRFGPTMEWDTAAGDAVLRAAGGSVVTPDGAPMRYGKWDRGLKNTSFIAWGAQR